MTRPAPHFIRRAARGLSLVELLVGIALGVFVLLGLVNATVSLMRSDVITATRMSNELRNAVYVIERDLRRAGYHGMASTALLSAPDAHVNPFAKLDVSTPGCVLYTYDRNSNGVQDIAGAADERYALVLSEGQLYLRRSGEDYNCDVTEGEWEPLLDAASVSVTDFSVAVAVAQTPVGEAPSTHKLNVRTVTYSVTTQLKSAPGKTRTHSGTLALPNNLLT